MPEQCDYLIVGGGLAGGHAASSIRKLDANERIVLVSDENYLPYDRVPLSKGYLIGQNPERTVILQERGILQEG
jgi:3-phenylpropionate/trans-cinnamate dioxygenase ferredoxin reductase component